MLILIAAPFGASNTRGDRRPIDIVGGLLATVAITAFVVGIVEGGRTGYTTPIPVIRTLAFVVSATGFVLVERRRAHPVVSLKTFVTRINIGALLVAAVALFSFASVAFLATLEMQRGHGLFSADRRRAPADAYSRIHRHKRPRRSRRNCKKF